MPLDALLLAVAAAFVHAAWNLSLSGSEDTHAATAVAAAAMGFVYPIVRGSAPVLVLVAGVVGGLASPSRLSAVGVIVVAAGIVLVRGLRATHEPRDLVLALAIGAFIASYTLVDK